jgi:PRTRC genetic system protein E
MFTELKELLRPGVVLNLNIMVSPDNPELLVVSTLVKSKSEDDAIQTKPMIITGTPEEIDAELADQLVKRKTSILKAFSVKAEGFDESLKEIEEEESKPKSAPPKKGGTIAKTPQAKDKPKTKEELLEEKLNLFYDHIEEATTESELMKIRTELNTLSKLNKNNVRITNMMKSCSTKILELPDPVDLPLETASDPDGDDPDTSTDVEEVESDRDADPMEDAGPVSDKIDEEKEEEVNPWD